MSEHSDVYYKQVRNDMGKLANRLSKLAIKLNYSDDDTMQRFLTLLMETCMWGIISLKDVTNRVDDPEPTMHRLNLNLDGVNMFLDFAHFYQRASFLTIFLFEVENLFTTILKESSSKEITGYSNICINVLEITYGKNIPEKKEKLQYPATIRNTLHSNGTHTQKTVEYAIHGQKIKCEKDKQIDAGWNIIIPALNDLVSVVEEILNHPKIKGLNRIKSPP